MKQSLRKKMVRYEGDDKCAICLSNLQSTIKNKFVVRLPCSHHFHSKCIKQWPLGECGYGWVPRRCTGRGRRGVGVGA